MRIGVKVGINGYGKFGDKCYEKMVEHGYTAADFQMVDTNEELYSLSDEDAKAYLEHQRELAEKAGVLMNQAHGPFRVPIKDGTPEDRENRLYYMKKSIGFAKILGVKYWVIHPICPKGTTDLIDGGAEETWKINLEFFRELLKTAEENDVIICMENLPWKNFSMATPEKVLEFVKEMNSDHFKICLDTGHVQTFTDEAGEIVRKLGSEIRVFHIHDSIYGMDPHMFPYFGRINWEDFLKALKEIEFDGVFSLETMASPKLDIESFDEFGIALANLARKMIAKIK